MIEDHHESDPKPKSREDLVAFLKNDGVPEHEKKLAAGIFLDARQKEVTEKPGELSVVCWSLDLAGLYLDAGLIVEAEENLQAGWDLLQPYLPENDSSDPIDVNVEKAYYQAYDIKEAIKVAKIKKERDGAEHLFEAGEMELAVQHCDTAWEMLHAGLSGEMPQPLLEEFYELVDLRRKLGIGNKSKA